MHRPAGLLAFLNVGLGAVLVFGGPLRTSSASFETAKSYLPIQTWGVLFLVAGAICFIAALQRPCSPERRAGEIRRCTIAAVLVGLSSGLHAWWTLSLVQSVQHDDRAALTAVVMCAWAVLCHWIAASRLARLAG